MKYILVLFIVAATVAVISMEESDSPTTQEPSTQDFIGIYRKNPLFFAN